MIVRPDQTLALVRTGFTQDQAGALVATIDRSAAHAVDDLRREMEAWHIALTLYLLLQIGVVLLAALMVQALRDPGRGRVACEVGAWHAASVCDPTPVVRDRMRQAL